MAMSLARWKAAVPMAHQKRLDAMADEIAQQAAHLAAAEYRWLCLLGEYDAEDGWVGGGAKSCAAWLSFACGLAPGAARERVRVARALRELPRVSEAFSNGQISYSKVRAITRVADEQNEQTLVTYAQHSTAAQLEKVIRQFRRVQRQQEALEDQQRHERRSLRYWVDEDGFVCISARLSPDDGALVVAQIERLAETAGEGDPAPPAPDAGVSAETSEAGRGDAPVASSRWDAAPPAEVRRADALRIMAETAAATGPKACVGGETHLVVVHASSGELRDGASSSSDFPAETHIAGVGRVSAETVRRIACDATIVTMVEDALGQPLGIGRQSVKVPRWLRRLLKRRDADTCRFPSCAAQRFVDAHHIQHWADGGTTDLDNLVLLCRFHHRLVHEAGYQITIKQPGVFTFLRPDGTAIALLPPPQSGDGSVPLAENDAHGVSITPETGIPDWDGLAPDYSLAVGLLLDVSAGTPAHAGYH